ncbi:MAG: glucosamine-6-phosphate deaminase [Oscillospiraceae bacterium]|nr:glucosamine-6-phosphate deaminase [Oscillospiraceae bacterium]
MRSIQKDLLNVKIFETRAEMGKAAAMDVKDRILSLLEVKDTINMIFAAAPSQNEVLAALSADTEIPWNRVNAFHMDEYVGLSPEAPQGFGNFLKDHIFSLVPFQSIHYIDMSASDAEEECARYSALLRQYPTDIVVLGIGENGHIAFNDPPVADFDDPLAVKPVALDDICRNQQVHDGCFSHIDDVPKTAITLTVPTLFAGEYLFCVVPAKTKAPAVYATLYGEISENCPATILRRHQNALLYLDSDSSSLLDI